MTFSLPNKNQYTGVNLSGGEFGAINGQFNHAYLYPSEETIFLYKRMGCNIVRVPFLWERVQPNLSSSLSTIEMDRLKSSVINATNLGMTVILDMHNYGAHQGNPIVNVSPDILGVFWAHFMATFAQCTPPIQDRIWIGLMNEPFAQSPSQWASIAQQAILTIRSAGITNTILVPGTWYTGAHSWMNRDHNGDSNSTAMLIVGDPLNKMLIEMHQYFDADYSGTHPDCHPNSIDVLLGGATQWLRQHNLKGFMAEFGVGSNLLCLSVLEDFLTHLSDHRDVWIGWTYWNACPWNQGYQFSVYPPDESVHPQVGILKSAMDGSSGGGQ